ETRTCHICQKSGHISINCRWNPNSQNYAGAQWNGGKGGNQHNQHPPNNHSQQPAFW
ncbi:unnamed protein product, partial [Amoebophrya sp. A25]